MTDTMSIPEQPQLNRLFRLQYEEAQKCYVLLYPEGMVKLNQSASEILLLCNGQHSVDTIVSTLESKFGVQNLRADVTAMLEEASRRNWIE